MGNKNSTELKTLQHSTDALHKATGFNKVEARKVFAIFNQFSQPVTKKVAALSPTAQTVSEHTAQSSSATTTTTTSSSTTTTTTSPSSSSSTPASASAQDSITESSKSNSSIASKNSKIADSSATSSIDDDEIVAQGLDKDAFNGALKALEVYGLNKISGTPLADRLFVLFDTDGNGVIDRREFVSGISLLAKGTIEDKLELTFKAYDIDNSGYIDLEELVDLFTETYESAMNALKAALLDEGSRDQTEIVEFFKNLKKRFRQTMEDMMLNAIKALDENDDRKLDVEEFKSFALSSPKVTATLKGFKIEIPMTFVLQ